MYGITTIRLYYVRHNGNIKRYRNKPLKLKSKHRIDSETSVASTVNGLKCKEAI